jgi:hypothetical protein
MVLSSVGPDAGISFLFENAYAQAPPESGRLYCELG